MRISACVIAKNEEENISRSILSYKNIVDEIILVDTGSEDNTVVIAKGLGAKVFHFTWRNDFSSAKNFALSKATGDWIIFLDADEYIEMETAVKIPAILKKINNDFSLEALSIKMLHTNGFKGRIISENPSIRVFRNRKDIKFEGSIHEKPLVNGAPLHALNPTNLNLKIIHTGYEVGDKLIAKFERNLKLLEKQLMTDKVDAMTFYYLSATYSSLGNPELAIKYGQKALEDKTLFKSVVAHKPYVFILKAMLERLSEYSYEEIQRVIGNAVSKFPNHPEIIRLRAELYKKNKMYDEAFSDYALSLELNDNFQDFLINDYYLYIDQVYNELGTISLMKKDKGAALEYFFLSLKENNFNQDSLVKLVRISSNTDVEEIIYLLNSVYQINEFKNIEFLISILSQIKSKALIYYQEVWNKDYKEEDLSLIVTFLLLKKYEKAYHLIVNLLKKHTNKQLELFLLITSLLIDRKSCYEKCIDLLTDENIIDILKNLAFEKKIKVKEKDIVISVIRELILLNEDITINKFLDKIELKSVGDFYENIGNLYFNIQDYINSKLWYTMSMETNSYILKREILFKIGICEFQLDEYINSYIYFIRAENEGYDKEEILQYINWLPITYKISE